MRSEFHSRVGGKLAQEEGALHIVDRERVIRGVDHCECLGVECLDREHRTLAVVTKIHQFSTKTPECHIGIRLWEGL